MFEIKIKEKQVTEALQRRIGRLEKDSAKMRKLQLAAKKSTGEDASAVLKEVLGKGRLNKELKDVLKKTR